MKHLHLLLAFALSATAAAQTVGPAPSISVQPSHIDSTAELAKLMQASEYVIPIEKYDLLSVRIVGADELSVHTRVAPDGGIDIPLAGHISVVGLSIEEAQNAIAKLVRDKNLVLSPGVSIEVIDSPGRTITVSGEVAKPGVYAAAGDAGGSLNGVRTLSQLVSLAGGLKDTASGIVTLVRPSLPGPVSIPLGTDPNHQPYASLPVFSGDEIRVAHVGQAYVIGAVPKQGAIPLKNYSPTTISQAVSIAGGIGFEASANSARLVRVDGDKRVVTIVHVRKILKGKEPDFALQNDDILYIPTEAGKAALKSGAAGIILSIVGLYLYTH
jgi:protein involved in polysaccharide export with SLBB domain